MTFHDHFSARAAEYARFRPHYPDALFDWLAARAPARRLALDCATGNGQAAVKLARHFARVVATDPSEEQLRYAGAAAGVEYRRAVAHESGLPAAGADLVTIAQALHWVDRPAFYAEVRRVLAPGGVVAAWCYSLMRCGCAADELVDRFYHDVVGSHWPPERRHTEDGYRSLEFPFAEVAAPPFEMRAAMTLDDLAGYLGTWSATQRYRAATGRDPVPSLVEDVRPVWGDGPREVRWPLWLRVGRA
jgi:SAM-dependent methyltransferase